MKISVIIPVYNASQYLPELFHSLQAQTCSDFEVIFVDDGSIDNSISMIQAFQTKSNLSIRIYTQDHQYAGVARNLALSKSHAEYVIFLDADDFFEPDYLEKLYYTCHNQNADVGICNIDQFLVSSNTFEPVFCVNSRQIPKKTVFNKTDLKKNTFLFCTGSPWNKMVRREFLLENNIQFQAIRHANDFLFSKLCIAMANRICYIDGSPLYHYRRGMESNLQATRSKDISCEAKAFSGLKEELQKRGLFQGTIRESYYECLITTFYWRLYDCDSHSTEFLGLFLLFSQELLADVDSHKLTLRPKNHFILQFIIKMKALPDSQKPNAFSKLMRIMDCKPKMLWHIFCSYGFRKTISYGLHRI